MNNILIGKTTEHLIQDSHSNLLIHIGMKSALESLRTAASQDGFSLDLASAFRGFDHQLSIWNTKAQGQRPLFNDQGIALDYKSLTPTEIVYAILRWSALPGASRHHWGTDIDVFDKTLMPEGHKLQLTPEETAPDGVFGNFHLWLDDHIEDFGFYRPYDVDRGGIAPEKWHLSYRPLSKDYQTELTYELLRETISNTEIELKSIILSELPEIYSRFIDI